MWKAAAGGGTLATLADVWAANLLDNWLADAGTTLSSGNVSVWTSQNGLGTAVSWGGGNQPLTTDAGQASVYFQQYGQILVSNPTGYPTGTDGTTTVMVARLFANDAYTVFLRYVGNYFGTMGPGDGWAYNPGYPDTRSSGVNPSAGYDIVVISVASGTNPAIKIRVNGTQVYSGTVGTRSLSLSTDNLQIGRNAGGPAPTDGWSQWRQAAIVNRGSTDPEMEECEGVVAWYWGLQTGGGGILPPGHPYYSAPPYA